jgi:hypothetical protein
MLLVNGSYYPYFEFFLADTLSFLNASMSRFIKLALVNKSEIFAGTPVPFYFIANDGNFVVSPIQMTQLEEQGVGKHYDIVIDFSAFRGDACLNLLKQDDGRKPDGAVSISKAVGMDDPASVLSWNSVSSTRCRASTIDHDVHRRQPGSSVDLSSDWSTGRKTLTTQIPVVAPFGKG